MKYRRLGKTELTVSVIGIGTWQFGGEWGKEFQQAEVHTILNRAFELGINLIDTAECYGDHTSERLIGQAIRQNRQDWIIATKFGHRYLGNFQREQLWSAQDVQKQLEESLWALQTDYLDLYQFHSGEDDAFLNEDLWTMLHKQVELGKIRHLGISISSRGDRTLQVAKASQVGAGAIQLVYNRLNRQAEETIFPLCIQQDLGVMARVPLASGLLSGKYKPGDQFTVLTDVRSIMDAQKLEQDLRAVKEIQEKEVPPGIPMASWALAWCLNQPAVTCVIPGCKSVQQLEVNASAAEISLTRENPTL